MKKSTKLTIFVFTLIAAALALFVFVYRPRLPQKSEPEVVRAKVLHPSAAEEAAVHEEMPLHDDHDSEQAVSLIPLEKGETLLGAISIDMNGDAMDDQIISVLKNGSPFVHLVTGIFTPSKASYERVSEIQTEVRQVKSFSFSVLDMTGEHVNSLTYSGLNAKGESVLKVFMPDTAAGAFEYKTIADLTADGSIFIQQLQRSDPYSFSQTLGESFPIHVYSSDSSRGQNSLDQIQSLYGWDRGERRYVKVSETRVPGKAIAASELAKIQDGNPATFEAFLSGLWYKSSNSGADLLYVFFNPQTRELIFSDGTSQEPYEWATTATRRNGVHITAMNNSINNLMRRIDIVLNGLDEIKVHVNDDLKMSIGEDTLFDGTYKKLSTKALQQPSANEGAAFLKKIETDALQWNAGSVAVTIKDGRFAAAGAEWALQGAVASTTVNGTVLLEFRTFGDTPFLSGYYEPLLEQSVVGEALRETLTLTPVSVSASGFAQSNAAAVKLER